MCCLIYKFLLILTQKMRISFLKILPENALKFVSKKMRICVKNFAQLHLLLYSLERKVVFMRKKNYKGAKVSKRVVAKCEGVCRTYDAIQYAYANLLSEAEEVKSFQVNVLLQGLEEGAYTSDFVITKADGNLMVRECVSRKHLTKPMTTKLLDASRNYWKSHGVSDWSIVIEEEE